MRINHPVSSVEYEIDGSRSIYSTTDLKGRITHANPYFIEVSGFTEEELIGSPHNMVRHPDMPPAAFADLWSTIKSGQPWTAMVKNRRKNGDYYWVEATVTPIMESGAITGYISVRTKPSRHQIDAAARLYKAEMERPGSLTLRQGNVVTGGLLGRAIALCQLSLGQRIGLAQLFMLGVIGALGWTAWTSEAIAAAGLQVWLGSLAGAAMTASALSWYFLANKIVAPIKTALKVAQGIAGGDLTAAIDVNRTDELGQLIRAVRQVNSNLHCIVGDIRENFSSMQSATRDIAVGNTDLSARTDSQAAALEETAASMEQLAATVQKNAEHTHQGTDVADGAMSTAKKGGDIMTRVVSTINDISESSAKISDIVGIINGIASQTNLLALNAAVEAARAGDAGRGFAVVAMEVKALAAQTAKATEEIAEQIGSIQDLTAQTVAAIRSIDGVMTDIGGLTAAIAGAVEEQTLSTQMIAHNVQEAALGARELAGKMTVVTEAIDGTSRSAMAVHETSQSFSAQASTLEDAVETFLTRVTAA